jgi:hypothetical protein
MQKERYVRLRRKAPATPRRLARMVQRCLRARPQSRPAETREMRVALEAMVGPISPTDLRTELASWLWSRQVFERRQNETVVQVTATVSGRRAGGRRIARPLLAVLLATLAAAIAFELEIQPQLPSALDRLLEPDASPVPADAVDPRPDASRR